METIKWCMLFISFSCIQLAYSETIKGKVVKVSDGDTLTILVMEKLQIKVRLVEIDAPEKGQSFGKKSRQSLAKICLHQQASVLYSKQDQYGRILGTVFCNHINANKWQLEQGMAWVYDQYVTDKTLYSLQKKAQINKLGLWRDQNPVPPWEFRKQSKSSGWFS